MKQLCKDIRKFDRLIVYWGKDRRHDIPFLRARALTYNLDFPSYKEIIVNDVYDIIKNKLRLSRNRMQNACEHLGINAKTHPLKPKIWQRARAGCPKSLKYILAHNIEDVVSLEALWKKVKPFTRQPNTSI